MKQLKKISWLASVITLTTAAPLAAHEYWIDPIVDTSAGEPIVSAHLRVGEDLSGSALPYLDTTVRKMIHHAPTASGPIPARLGDRPAIDGVGLAEEGLHILTVETHPAYVVFDMPDFADYLDYEGIGKIAVAHRARGLPDEDIAEEYVRNARALIQIGPVDDADIDRSTGLPFELTVLGSPFAVRDELSVRLQWRGDAVIDAQVALFHRSATGTAPEDTTRILARTDPSGVARFPLPVPGQYMLNAVRIVPVEGPGNVVWQSHWASLTFEIPAAE